MELIESATTKKDDDELVCCLCNEDIVINYYFICEECNDNKKYCKSCRGIGKSIHEHKLTKVYFFIFIYIKKVFIRRRK